jgi:hypothetical protein
VVSDSLDTLVLEADGFQEAIPVVLDSIQHFLTFRKLKLVAIWGCHRELVILVIISFVKETQTEGILLTNR